MKAHRTDATKVSFRCPGCDSTHTITDAPLGWSFNGDFEQPTFFPSVMVTNGHYVPGFEPGDGCWCTHNAEHPDDPSPFVCGVCHSCVTNGRIQFLSDCTHALAGQTVDLPDWEEEVQAQ